MHPLASETWGPEEREAINRVCDSGRFTMGAEVKRFEAQFAEYVGSRHAVMVNSGSSANLLMVAALVYLGHWQRGHVVTVPAVSWSTTYAPLIQFGLKLRFVDVDDSLCVRPDQVQGDLFAVDLLGNNCDWRNIHAGLVIEDCCESMGATYNGKHAGTFGLMGSYSTFFSHHMSTMEGGIIVTDDDECWKILLALRAHGWTRDLPGHKPSFYNSFEFIVPGYSVRPTEIQGAIGQEQLKKLPAFIKQRRENAKQYTGFLREVGESSWFGFPYLSDHRDSLVSNEVAEMRPIVAGNFLRHKAAKFADYLVPYPLNLANLVHDNGYFIGNHHYAFDLHHIEDRLSNAHQSGLSAA